MSSLAIESTIRRCPVDLGQRPANRLEPRDNLCRSLNLRRVGIFKAAPAPAAFPTLRTARLSVHTDLGLSALVIPRI